MWHAHPLSPIASQEVQVRRCVGASRSEAMITGGVFERELYLSDVPLRLGVDEEMGTSSQRRRP